MGIRLLFGTMMFAAAPAVWGEDPKPIHTLRPPADVTWLSFTPDSKQLLTGGNAVPNLADEISYELRLWSVASGGLVAASPKSSGVGASGVVSPDGRMALTGGSSGEWRLWELPGLKTVRRGQLDNLRVHRVAFRPDGKAFTVLLRDSLGRQNWAKYNAFTFDAAGGRPLDKPTPWPPERPQGSPVGEQSTGPPAGWAVGNDPPFDRTGVLVAPAGRVGEALEVPGDDAGCGGPMARAFSRDGKRALSAGCNGQVVLWDYPAGTVVGKPLVTHPRLAVRDPGLAIAADGRRAAVAGMDKVFEANLPSLTVYDLDSRKVVAGPLKVGSIGVGLINALAFSPDGSVLAVAFSRRGAGVAKPSTEVQLWSMPAQE